MNKNKCPLSYTMGLIGTKWKPLVLFHLLDGPLRSGVLQKKVPEISNKIPPKVEYQLSARGKSLGPILKSLDQWGEEDCGLS